MVVDTTIERRNEELCRRRVPGGPSDHDLGRDWGMSRARVHQICGPRQRSAATRTKTTVWLLPAAHETLVSLAQDLGYRKRTKEGAGVEGSIGELLEGIVEGTADIIHSPANGTTPFPEEPRQKVAIYLKPLARTSLVNLAANRGYKPRNTLSRQTGSIAELLEAIADGRETVRRR